MSQITGFLDYAPVGAGVNIIRSATDGVDVVPDGAGRITYTGINGIEVTSPALNVIQIDNTLAAFEFMPNDGNIVTPLLGRTNVLGTANQIITSSFGGAPSHTIIVGLTDDVIVRNNLTALNNLIAIHNITGDSVVGATSVGGGAVYSNTTVQAETGVIVNSGGIDAAGLIRFRNLGRGVVQSNVNGYISSSAGAEGEIIIGQGVFSQPIWRRLYSPNDSITITHDPATGNINLQTGPIDTIEFHAKNLSHAHAAGGRFYIVGDGISPLGNINSVASQNDVNYGNFPSITFSLADDIHIVRDIFAGRDLSANRNATVHGTLAVTGVSTLTGAVVCGNTLVANSNITSQHGFIRATNGNVVAGLMVNAGTGITSTNGDIIALNGAIIAKQGFIALSVGADITGNLFLRPAAPGVLSVNPAHAVTSSNGTNGQVLIAATAGGVPLWRNMIAEGGIVITNGPNSVTIGTSGAGVARMAFKVQQQNTGFLWGNLPEQFLGITLRPVTIVFDPFGIINPGDGANRMEFTAPVTGLYNLIWRTEFYRKDPVVAAGVVRTYMYMHTSGGANYTYSLHSLPYPGGTVYNGQYSESIYLTLGQYVWFGIQMYYPNSTHTIGMNSNSSITGFIVS